MTGDDSRVIVVRAWRDSGRLIIRVLVGAGHVSPSQQWVFADVDQACRRIGEVLRDLGDEGQVTDPAVSDHETKR